MKISNADGIEFEQAVTVPDATLDGHAINKGQADDLYAPIGGGGVTDHGALTGLTPDDDHTQYVLAAGGRDITGSQNVDGKLRTGKVGAGAPTHQFEVHAGHINFVSVPNVAAAPIVLNLAGTPGNVDNGEHRYKIAYVTAYGVTGIYPYYWSDAITVVDKTSNGQVNLSNIPVSGDAAVTSRRLYRSKVGDPNGAYYLLATLNLTDTTYTDNTADADLGANSTYQTNSTAGRVYLDGDLMMQLNYGVTALGASALSALTSGTSLVAIGSRALLSAISAINSVGVGNSALQSLSTGNSNVAVGVAALQNVTDGFGNVGIGTLAGAYITGIYNTLIGDNAGCLITGNYNVAIGFYAGKNAGSSGVFVGSLAGIYETGSSKLFIDNTTRGGEADARIKALIYGEFHADPVSQLLRVNAVLDSLMTDAATNATTTQRKKRHNTTGTAANGFGTRDLWQLQSSTMVDQDAAAVDVVWNDATHATRKADLVLSAFDTAIREGIRIRANGSAPAIGFLGATPVARAAHIADAKTDYTAGDLDSEAEIISALNTLNGKINSILAVLENVGLVATS